MDSSVLVSTQEFVDFAGKYLGVGRPAVLATRVLHINVNLQRWSPFLGEDHLDNRVPDRIARIGRPLWYYQTVAAQSAAFPGHVWFAMLFPRSSGQVSFPSEYETLLCSGSLMALGL